MRRLRRARTLYIEWSEGKVVFTNYRTRVSVQMNTNALILLDLFDNWALPSEVIKALPYSPRSVKRAIRDLRQHDLLIVQGTRAAMEDDKMERAWRTWRPAAAFHFATKNDRDTISDFEVSQLITGYLTKSSQPTRSKNYRTANRIQLTTDDLPNRTFGDVLSSRRTCRSFSADKLSFQSLSTLLNQTWGVHGYVDAPPFGRLLLKTSPSAGARHPVEVYVLINRVEGIRQGLYHYDGRGHQLVFLRKIAATRTVEYGAGQSFMSDAAAIFIMTAVFPRVQWKYRFGRAYRTVLLDAGHLCQTFYLVATSLGLGPFCTALFRDDLIEKDLSLDTVSESAIYIAGVGIPRSSISVDKR